MPSIGCSALSADLGEALKVLGAPKWASQGPLDFPSTAHLLKWLLCRCTAEAASLQLPVSRDGPAGCAAFLREAGSLAATHAHVWLDLYQLFLGSSAAVTQLVKLAGSISEPSQLVQQEAAGPRRADPAAEQQLPELQQRLMQQGQMLQQALEQEPAQQLLRHRAMEAAGKPQQVAALIATRTAAAQADIQSTSATLAEAQAQCRQLEGVWDKLWAESKDLDRRLVNSREHPPKHAAEQARLQAELQRLFHMYRSREMNIRALEAKVKQCHAVSQASIQEASRGLRKLQRRMRQEEREMLEASGGAALQALHTADEPELLTDSEDDSPLGPALGAGFRS